MLATSFTLAVLKPEIAPGFCNFVVPTTTTSLSQSGRDGSDPSEEAVDEAAVGDGALSSRVFAAAQALASVIKQPLATIVAVNRIAHTPLPTPRYPPQQMLETVLIQALDAMLQCEVGNQLDVCAWLGKWLLEYAANQQGKLASDIPLKDETANRKHKAVPAKQKIADTNTQVQALDHMIQKVCADHHSVVAIVYPDSVTMGTRSSMRDALQRLSTPEFVFVDSDRGSLDHSGEAPIRAPRRQLSMTYLITVEPTQAVTLSVSKDMEKWTPQVSYRLSATAISSTLSSFFSPIFHPTLVVVHDTQQLVSVAHWCALADRRGFAVLAWEQLLQARITHEGDPSGVFTQWQQTKANMPSEMLLALLREAIHAAPDTDNVGFSHRGGVANKFLICGFPLAACLPTSFEKHVGSIYRVDEDAWLSFARKRGVIADLKDPPANSSLSPDMKKKDGGFIDNLTVAHCFQPRIGLCIHDANYDDTDDPSASGCDVIAILKRVVLRANAPGRGKVLVYGFPRSNTAVSAFIAAVGAPAFVIHCSSTSEATNAAESLVVWDAYPHIVQFEVASSETCASLQRLFFGKSVSFVVGDLADLNSTTLRDLMSVHGYAILDLRKRPDEKDTKVDSLEDVVNDIVHRIQAVHAPRCIVLGGSAHLAFALVAVIGSAVEKIVILKQVEQRPLPRIRRDGDENYNSDEAEEQERQRQLNAHKSRDSSNSGVAITKVTFVKLGDSLYAQLCALLRPIAIGVIGHPCTFYQAAVAGCAHRHQLGVLQLSSTASATSQNSQSCSTDQKPQPLLDERLAVLQQLITETPFATYLVDGFPRVTEDTWSSLSPAPYAAQQVWALETKVASMPALVHFTASMDVLVERKPATRSRLVLEDAQDALAFFSVASKPRNGERQRRVLSVNCERELRDVQEELEDALLRHGLIR
ncbi:hypothetical protein FI667_g7298, partial [Globisporangium splendens]